LGSVDALRQFEAQGSDYLTARRAREQQRRAKWLQEGLGVPADKVDAIIRYYSPGWEANYPCV
jgi:hypothetical protein